MENKITHFHDSDTNIFYKYYNGDIYLNDIISDWNRLIDNQKLPTGVKRFILDYRKANLLTPPNQAKDIADFYKENPSAFEQSKIALIMEKPDQVILPILANEECPGYIEFKPFCTLEGAFDWVSQ